MQLGGDPEIELIGGGDLGDSNPLNPALPEGFDPILSSDARSNRNLRNGIAMEVSRRDPRGQPS
jgi:hypothetical protein